MSEKWNDPITIEELLQQVYQNQNFLPEEKVVYLVSTKGWNKAPSTLDGILYIGTNTGISKRFRTRIGDMIADMLGFFDSNNGHHSGGRKLYVCCKSNSIKPYELFFGFLETDENCKKKENELIRNLKPQLNGWGVKADAKLSSNFF